MYRTAIAVLVVLTSLAPAAEPRDNWPAWRGPTANGVASASARPPLRWDEKTNIKWKAEVPGRGSATPIVWGDQVFVVTGVPTDRVATPADQPADDPRFPTKTTRPNRFYRFEVHSFDRDTGKLRWKQVAAEAVPHEGHHPTHSYAAGSPTTDGTRLVVSFGSFGVYAYDLNGKLLWKRDLGRLRTRLGWGEAVTPVLHRDAVILNWDQEADARLIVLDAATGKTRWEVARDEKSSWNTPFVVEHRGVTQVIVNGTTRVRSYDLATGKVLWAVGGMTVNAIPSPLAADGVAYVMSGYRGAAAVAVSLDARGELDGDKLLWRYDRGTPYVPSPLLFDGRLYFTQANDNVLTILDARTGKELARGVRLTPLRTLYASPMAAAGRIYFVDRAGTTVVLAAGPDARVRAVNRLPEGVDASPVAVGKTLFLRGEKHLYAIEER
ncbi:MAG: PQQ-binding-like beta-propeller repeat protein [Gemmataceae bacterium]